jgi:hypothetical protein
MIYPIIIEADLIRSYGKILPKIDGILLSLSKNLRGNFKIYEIFA